MDIKANKASEASKGVNAADAGQVPDKSKADSVQMAKAAVNSNTDRREVKSEFASTKNSGWNKISHVERKALGPEKAL